MKEPLPLLLIASLSCLLTYAFAESNMHRSQLERNGSFVPEESSHQKTRPTRLILESEGGEKDYTPILYSFLQANKGGDIELVFKKGIYHFFPEKAYEKYLKISNNDNGSRRIAFPLIGFNSIRIQGGESEFIFHGSIVPFVVENVNEAHLESFNVNWDHPFTFEGTVIRSNPEERSFTVQVGKDDNYIIRNQELFLKGYDWEMPMGDNILIDKEKRRPYFHCKKYKNWQPFVAKEIEPRIIKFSGISRQRTIPPVGSVWVDKGSDGNRKFPAFRLYRSSNLRLADINVYAAGAMALIGEKLEDVSMDNFNVTVPKNSGRMMGATADATHFINCKGLISYKDCTFEAMGDDASNVHGTYMKVVDVIDHHTVGISAHHHQQNGFDFAEAGDTVRFITRTNLQGVQTAVVTRIKQVNEGYYHLSINKNLTENAKDYTAVENTSWSAALRMENCVVRYNRARSILVSTDKKVEILNNYFSSMMAGIRICGDANHWFESGPVADVTISGNTFEDLAIGGGKPQAILQIDPVIAKEFRKSGYYHRNITFENNIVKTFDPLIVYALSVDGLTIRNNEIIKTDTYPSLYGDLSQFDIQDCANVMIEGNTYHGPELAEISIENSDQVKTKPQKGFNTKIVSNPNQYFYQK